jgi:DNA-binding transcriptional regulator YdaS (Cro superfamily)
MNLSEYLSQERGRQSALATAIGAHSPDVSRWADGTRPIPVHYGASIEIATGGAVTRQEMFPNDWQTIWPELVTPATDRRKSKQSPEQIRETTPPVGRIAPPKGIEV